jgi:hypothetical protein
MRLGKNSVGACLATVVGVCGLGTPARAGSHLWRISEVFSNADGSIQFIELKCDVSGENFISGKQVTSNGHVFTIPAHIGGDTADAKLLFATSAFAALPGAPTPDYTIVANFFSVNGDTLRYAPANNYDAFTFGPGALPTDMHRSIQLTSWNSPPDDTFITAANNPTNYDGESATVGCNDSDGDGYGSPGNAGCPNGPEEDCNNNDDTVYPGAPELCTDNKDNDCDTFEDCADPTCATVVPDCIPAVSQWGLIALVLILANAGTVLAVRRSPGTS